MGFVVLNFVVNPHCEQSEVKISPRVHQYEETRQVGWGGESNTWELSATRSSSDSRCPRIHWSLGSRVATCE
jgi:hypothetical protein